MLSNLLDQDTAQSVRFLADEMDLETGPFARPGEAPRAAPRLLELLGTADRCQVVAMTMLLPRHTVLVQYRGSLTTVLILKVAMHHV